MKIFDIFISYRRSDNEFAAKLYEELIKDGYTVFWDEKSLACGRYTEDIKTAIQHCKNFLLLINDDTLDRSYNDPNDWIVEEVAEALKNNKNIVPLFIGKLKTFPKVLPQKINVLSNYNGITEFTYQNSDFMKQLEMKFLKNDDLYSNIEDFEIDGTRLVKCKRQTLHVTIPKGIEVICEGAFAECTKINEVVFNEELIEIQAHAFQRGRNIEYIKLPERLKYIGKQAFYRCQGLKSIKISSSVEVIESQAFAFCDAIKEITLGKNLKEIDVTAFEDCIKLESIKVDKDNTSFTADKGVLYNKNKSVLLKVPLSTKGEFVVPQSVEVIGDYALSGTKIHRITINKPLVAIQKYAFFNSSVEQIVYPFDIGMINIDKLAFVGSDNIVDNPFKERIEEEPGRSMPIFRSVPYEHIIVKTSFESEEEAYNMIKMLLERRLIVSGQIKEHQAVYTWDGAISNEREYELLCFTRGSLYGLVEHFIVAHHSYECPEILCLPIIDVYKDFGEWINQGTKYGGIK